MSEKRRSCFSLLLGEETDSNLEILAAEAFLSGISFPTSLLNRSDAERLENYERWLSKLPRRDANEVAFASLLTEEFRNLNLERCLDEER